MKKIVKITESDITRIVKRVIKENVDDGIKDNKRSKFLDNVVIMLVKQTKMVGTTKSYKYPYYRIIYQPPFSRMNQFLSNFYYSDFSDYCKKMFNLKDEEIDYVWRKYKKILSNKK